MSIVFLNDEEIQELNTEWRGKNKTTDVLSFPLYGEGIITDCLGELYINLAQAERQCGDFGTTPMEELVRLVIHGTLHLFGFDHEDGVASELREEMERWEDLLFSRYASFLTDG